MNNESGRLYEFVFRGLLTEEALDRAGRPIRNVSGILEVELAKVLSIDLLDDVLIDSARRMATVYAAIAAFENSVRRLVSKVLLDESGGDWWKKCVSAPIRSKTEKRREDEERNRWHSHRGGDPINYTDMGDLAKIIQKNWTVFEPYIPSIEWAAAIFKIIERSRNVIMHSGSLEREDIERIGINIRDWIKQVGT